MKFTLENLEKAGAFAGGAVEREITLQMGGEEVKATVYVRRPSYKNAVFDLVSMIDKTGHPNRDPLVNRIALCICDENGDPVFSPADITGVNDDGTQIMKTDPETGEVLVDSKGQPIPRGWIDDKITHKLLKLITEVSTEGKPTH